MDASTQSPRGSAILANGGALVYGTNLDHIGGLKARVFPGAYEATARYIGRRASPRATTRRDIAADERRQNRIAGVRRACAECRRYAVHSNLTGLAVLTFADAVDLAGAWACWTRFARRVRRRFGRFPWIVSAEQHIRHGVHLNWLLPPGNHSGLLAMWSHGSTSQPRTGALPGLTTAEKARALVRYMSKDWEAAPDQTPPGHHRYRCARGFAPDFFEVWARDLRDLYAFVTEYFGEQPSVFGSSHDLADWGGPSAVWMQWR